MRPGAGFMLLCALFVGCGEGLRTARPVDCDPQLDEGCTSRPQPDEDTIIHVA